MDRKAQIGSGLALVGAAVVLVLSCTIPQNPVRAGSGTSTAAHLDHAIDFGGHKHADGYCGAIEGGQEAFAALSKGEIRTSRWVPCSTDNVPYAKGALMENVADFRPASSAYDVS